MERCPHPRTGGITPGVREKTSGDPLLVASLRFLALEYMRLYNGVCNWKVRVCPHVKDLCLEKSEPTTKFKCLCPFYVVSIDTFDI